ncbi:Endoribonuclease YbeY [bioreactor metagenome]|uniref:Endoribonuclease YbeY n=1 Tax=bioreactor metagenome TaxID=1076179 RepID=A0A644T5X9_9ZZZZ|nr:rRNA maturation RNase YbeY [Candidatus Elulimicrobiales bacterium]
MILEEKNLIVNKKKGLIEKALFSRIQKIKNEILGESFFLSVNFISPALAKELNIKYRKKDYTPNILSFPLSKKEGEIFICLSVARSEAKNFSLSYENFLILLIIHGCLHLKGLDHGEKMEASESKYLKKYMIK